MCLLFVCVCQVGVCFSGASALFLSCVWSLFFIIQFFVCRGLSLLVGWFLASGVSFFVILSLSCHIVALFPCIVLALSVPLSVVFVMFRFL